MRVPVLGVQGRAVPPMPLELVLTFGHAELQAVQRALRHVREIAANFQLLPAQPGKGFAHGWAHNLDVTARERLLKDGVYLLAQKTRDVWHLMD